MKKKLEKKTKRDIRIVILDRGWIAVGVWSQHVSGDCRLDNAYIIRTWGTTAGIGQLALHGPTEATMLDPITVVHYDRRNEVANIECYSEKWEEIC